MATRLRPEPGPRPRGTLAPVAHRVRRRIREGHDTWTLALEPPGDAGLPQPGQFSMLYAPGVGEVPISTSGIEGSAVMHTIRAVGAVSGALCACKPGSVVGVRGPLGCGWPLDTARGRDLVFVAGGIGLAPIRSAVRDVLERRDEFGRVSVLVGARTPADLLFAAELEQWQPRGEIEVLATVDAASADWRGRVGLVTTLLGSATVDPARAVAMVCGPELMARLTGRALAERGVGPDRIWLSLERNMPCGVGLCGHCQLGPVLVCRDGPVLRFDRVEPLLEVPEL